jgi:hypothetical protein
VSIYNQSLETILVCISFLCFGTCRLPSSDGFPISVQSAAITLEWDAPALQFPSPPLSISAYRIFWRPHLTVGWNFFAEISATAHPTLAIKHSDLGDGKFDFAICAVMANGRTSELHSSLDASAIPYGGWYLVWFSTN